MSPNYCPPHTWAGHFRERAALAILAGFGTDSVIAVDGHHPQPMSRRDLAHEAIDRADALMSALSDRPLPPPTQGTT